MSKKRKYEDVVIVIERDDQEHDIIDVISKEYIGKYEQFIKNLEIKMHQPLIEAMWKSILSSKYLNRKLIE